MDIKEKIAVIEKTFYSTEPEDTAPILVERVMDDNWSLFKTFEELCGEYLNEDQTDDFRKGMDAALYALIGTDLAGLSQEILEELSKRETDDEEET